MRKCRVTNWRNCEKKTRVTPDLVFRDPYFLDFLGLKDRYIEKDIEDGIVRGLETFILELGAGFTFVARQKRVQVDHDDYYLDLLFFHRGLRRLVAIDLKLSEFQPGDKGPHKSIVFSVPFATSRKTDDSTQLVYCIKSLIFPLATRRSTWAAL